MIILVLGNRLDSVFLVIGFLGNYGIAELQNCVHPDVRPAGPARQETRLQTIDFDRFFFGKRDK